MRPLLTAALLIAVAGCDTTATGPLLFGGVEVEARGDARLDVEDDALVVSGLAGDRSGGFNVAGAPDRVDVITDPISIPVGGRFGIEVEDAAGAHLASIYNEGTGDGAFDVRVSFADGLGVEAVAVRYKLGGVLVLEIPRLLLVPDPVERRRATSSAGSGSGDSGSVHVIRENGRYIVVSDSQGAQDGARRSCGAFLLTSLPLRAGDNFPDGLCTDWIEVEPLDVGPMPRGRVAVTARGVGSFRVRALDAR